MERPSHAEQVERSFTVQADAFEDGARNRSFTSDARWVFDRLPRSADSLVLDVAAGTGHAARQLAPSVRAVVALDATPAMLHRGRTEADREKVMNIVFMRGEATALPFLDGSFDVVVSRFAAHHFERPVDVIAEMARCTRAGGHVALVDLIADDDRAVAAEQNRLERLRDPSHTRMLAPEEIRRVLLDCRLEPIDITARSVQRPLQPWLDQTAVDPQTAEHIRKTLRTELTGGAVTGFRPRMIDSELWFGETFVSSIAVRR